ncbi:hypothetical protein QUF90_23420 [Desulfococcaceae bacterium HSG9]|nr:hypothetical protein [Desulfococcaceae bacterium HSG9]
MLSDDKIEKLIEALNNKTKKQMINWEETVERGVYLAALTNSGVRISCRIQTDETAGEEFHEHILTVLNGHGMLVDEIKTVDNYKMKELYENARRMAMNADNVIENMLNELNSLSENKSNLITKKILEPLER